MSVGGITFKDAGYDVQLSDGSLTLMGTDIATEADATISGRPTGWLGMVKKGSGVLTLSSDNYPGLFINA